MIYIFIAINVLAVLSFLSIFTVLELRSISNENRILSSILETALEKDEISKAGKEIASILSTYYHMDYCSIYTADIKRKRLKLCYTNNPNDVARKIQEYVDELLIECINNPEKGAKRKSSNDYLNYPSAVERAVKYSLFIPLKHNNRSEIIGALLVENKDTVKSEKFERTFFETVTKYISLAMKNLLNSQKRDMMALTDGLTGTYNRLFLDKYLERKILESQSSQKPFVVVIYDIDHFKKVNDTCGHLIGDEVIKGFSKIVTDNIRESMDVVCRYGGEEFAIVIADVTAQEIYDKIDYLRMKMSEYLFKAPNNKTFFATASFGIAEYPNDSTNAKDLLICADKALYKAKKAGRNQVRIHNENI